MNRFYLFVLALVLFASCEKQDNPVVLPPPGDLTTGSATMGVNYDDQVYVDFETGKTRNIPYRSYDLAFEASPAGWRIYLNTGKFMFVANTGTNTLATADSAGQLWKTETDNLYDDSTAFGTLIDSAGQSLNNVFVIDRGRTEHTGAARWRKFQLVYVNSQEYRIRFSLYNNTQETEFTIPKNPAYSLMYFSFENGGHLADVAPEKDAWDIVFTKYTHTYYTEPLNSPYRYYLVAGALLNRWSGTLNEIVKQDSTPGFKPFDTVTAADMGTFSFYPEAAKIGFEWKEYDFNLGYTIETDRFYLLKDQAGYYYKIRFIDFYDDQGNKGTAKYEYQRL